MDCKARCSTAMSMSGGKYATQPNLSHCSACVICISKASIPVQFDGKSHLRE